VTLESGGTTTRESTQGRSITAATRAPSHEQIEQEIRRLEAAAGFEVSRVTWRKAKAIKRTLRWVLGLEPLSPMDHIMAPAPKRLPKATS